MDVSPGICCAAYTLVKKRCYWYSDAHWLQRVDFPAVHNIFFAQLRLYYYVFAAGSLGGQRTQAACACLIECGLQTNIYRLVWHLRTQCHLLFRHLAFSNRCRCSLLDLAVSSCQKAPNHFPQSHSSKFANCCSRGSTQYALQCFMYFSERH